MKKTKNVIPIESIFKDRDKEAKFWEENFDKALTDAKPITIKFAKNLSKTLNIRLDPITLNDVRKAAKAKGLGPTQLIRMWILEKLEGKNLAAR
jgi:predicted DNA binding CopG/RHH family protein